MSLHIPQIDGNGSHVGLRSIDARALGVPAASAVALESIQAYIIGLQQMSKLAVIRGLQAAVADTCQSG